MIVSIDRSSAIAKALTAISILAVLATMSLPVRTTAAHSGQPTVIAR